MLPSHLKIAWRQWRRLFWKDRSFSLLNLLGLSTGLACALLICLWATDEWRTDRFFQNDDRLYQVLRNSPVPDGIATVEYTPGPLAETIKEQLPDVEYAVPVIPASLSDQDGVISVGGQFLKAKVEYAGKDFLQVFSYPLLAGSREQVLAAKHSVLLSRQMAVKLFGRTDGVIGKNITWDKKDFAGVYTVSGVVDDLPPTATVRFDAIFSYDLYLEKVPKLQSWNYNEPSTYLLLRKGAQAGIVDTKITGWLKSRNAGTKETLFLQRYSDHYLHNHYENGAPSGGRIAYLRLFSLIAIFILIIACINFMNLSTARAAAQMKDAGVKKIMGATRGSLILQHLAFSLLMVFLSLVIAILLAACLLPSFNQLTGKELSLMPDFRLALSALGITLLTGLLAGSYPAFYLSGFNPMTALKGRLPKSPGELSIRKGLVVFQFTLSVLFILAVVVVYTQIQYIQTQNMGYNRDHLVYFERGGLLSDDKEDYAPGGKYETDLLSFVQAVRQTPGVMAAANFRHNITNRNGGTYDISWPGKDPNVRTDFTDLAVGYDFIETLAIPLVAGRSYSASYGSEKSNVIFNEAAIRAMGLKDPVGKKIRLWGEDRTIIGVVKDFHFQSLHENLKPCFFDLNVNHRASKVMARIGKGQEKETIERLRRLYTDFNPGFAFEYRWLDDDYQELYASEQRVGRLSAACAALAILISSLGLLGLAAFTTRKRQAEIGIRKVLGASVGGIVLLLSNDFIRLVGIAILIAVPAAWFGTDRWLSGFAYRAVIHWWLFALVPVAVIVIAILTVSTQSVKAALMNPVKSLRNE